MIALGCPRPEMECKDDSALPVDEVAQDPAPQPVEDASLPEPAPQIKAKEGMVYYSDDALRAMGFTIEYPAEDQKIVCREDQSSIHRCFCIEPFPERKRISFDESVSIFRKALEGGKGRTVLCDKAQTGRCDEYRYFHFDGDVHRVEDRYFDTTGQLAAVRDLTDYPAFCDGRAMEPGSMIVDEHLCGKDEGPVASPSQRMTGSPTCGNLRQRLRVFMLGFP